MKEHQAIRQAEFLYALVEQEKEEREYLAYLRRMRDRRNTIRNRVEKREVQAYA